MQDWNEYRTSLLATLDSANHKIRPPWTENHELITLAVAITTRCDGCIAVHTKNAADAGASLEEISEALGVAIAMNARAALTYSARAIGTYQQLPKKQPLQGELLAAD